MMDSVDFKTLTRPKSPNTFLCAPEGLCEAADPDVTSEVLPMAPAAVYEAILGLIDGRDDWSLEASEAERGLIHFVTTSRLMRFRDDVDVLVMPAEAGDPSGSRGSRLAVYSRSRVGHSDLGANRKRVMQMLESLNMVQVKT